MPEKPNVICLEDAAFFRLVELVVYRLQSSQIPPDRWVGTEEAMKLLGITSRTTLVKLQNEGKIRFTRATTRNTLYDRDSIMAYLDNKARNTF